MENNLTLLSSDELSNTNGGGLGYYIGYAVAALAGAVWSPFICAINANTPCPTASVEEECCD